MLRQLFYVLSATDEDLRADSSAKHKSKSIHRKGCISEIHTDQITIEMSDLLFITSPASWKRICKK